MMFAPPTLTSQSSLGGIPLEPSSLDNKKDLCDDDFGAAFLAPPSLTSQTSISGIILESPSLKQEESLSLCKDSMIFNSSKKSFSCPQGDVSSVEDSPRLD